MNDHDSTIFPHDANRKPQADANEEGEDVPWDDVHTRQAVANQLDDRSGPFNDVYALHVWGPWVVYLIGLMQ